jgi:hypothetical protein
MGLRVALFVHCCGVFGGGAKVGVGTSDASATVPDAGSRPSGCSGVENPVTSAECLGGLRAACRTFTTERDCAAAAPFSSDGVVCRWARVVRFSDSVSCAVESDEGRCEGGWTFPDDGPFCGLWSGFAAERELVWIAGCGGPVGPWDLIGADAGRVEGPCLNGTVPPPPDICQCAPRVDDAGR